jgi:hypothetical protein
VDRIDVEVQYLEFNKSDVLGLALLAINLARTNSIAHFFHCLIDHYENEDME